MMFFAIRYFAQGLERTMAIELAGNRTVDLGEVESLTCLMNRKAMPIRNITYKYKYTPLTSSKGSGKGGGGKGKGKRRARLSDAEEEPMQIDETLSETLRRIKPGESFQDSLRRRNNKSRQNGGGVITTTTATTLLRDQIQEQLQQQQHDVDMDEWKEKKRQEWLAHRMTQQQERFRQHQLKYQQRVEQQRLLLKQQQKQIKQQLKQQLNSKQSFRLAMPLRTRARSQSQVLVPVKTNPKNRRSRLRASAPPSTTFASSSHDQIVKHTSSHNLAGSEEKEKKDPRAAGETCSTVVSDQARVVIQVQPRTHLIHEPCNSIDLDDFFYPPDHDDPAHDEYHDPAEVDVDEVDVDDLDFIEAFNTTVAYHQPMLELEPNPSSLSSSSSSYPTMTNPQEPDCCSYDMNSMMDQPHKPGCCPSGAKCILLPITTDGATVATSPTTASTQPSTTNSSFNDNDANDDDMSCLVQMQQPLQPLVEPPVLEQRRIIVVQPQRALLLPQGNIPPPTKPIKNLQHYDSFPSVFSPTTHVHVPSPTMLHGPPPPPLSTNNGLWGTGTGPLSDVTASDSDQQQQQQHGAFKPRQVKSALKVKTLRDSLLSCNAMPIGRAAAAAASTKHPIEFGIPSRVQDAPPSAPRRRLSFSEDGSSSHSRWSIDDLDDDGDVDCDMDVDIDDFAMDCAAGGGVPMPPTQRPHVRWGFVELREYAQCLGDHPACSKGAPIQLDWNYQCMATLLIDQYEQSRQGQRGGDSLRIPSSYRQFLLMRLGYSPQDLAHAIRVKMLDQKKRVHTVSRLRFMKFDEKVEKMVRVLPNVAAAVATTVTTAVENATAAASVATGPTLAQQQHHYHHQQRVQATA